MFCCHECRSVFEEAQIKERLIIKKAVFYVFAISMMIVFCRLIAFLHYDSSAVRAVFFDSIKDSFVSLSNIAFIWISARKADQRFQFGYGKFESLASLFQAFFLVGMGIDLLFETFSAHNHNEGINETAVIALIISLFFLIAMAFLQSFYSKKIQSFALKADSAHYKADIVMNTVVILCFFTSQKIHWLDTAVGFGIAVYFFVIAFSVGKVALCNLLDKSLPIKVKQQIVEIVTSIDGANVSEIATKSLGRGEFFLIKILFNKNDNTESVAKIQKTVETTIHKNFPKAYVVVTPIFE